MWYLYLDESGDLGFDFVTKRPSEFFTVSILALRGVDTNRMLAKRVRRVLRKRGIVELKGSATPLPVKQYLYRLVKDLKFAVYAVTVNKRRVYESLRNRKERLYNYVARRVLDHVPFERAETRVQLIVDRSKGGPEIKEFNQYVIRQLQGRLNPAVPLEIYHWRSHEVPGLQVADVFCWGIFRKHERGDDVWFRTYQSNVRADERFL